MGPGPPVVGDRRRVYDESQRSRVVPDDVYQEVGVPLFSGGLLHLLGRPTTHLTKGVPLIFYLRSQVRSQSTEIIRSVLGPRSRTPVEEGRPLRSKERVRDWEEPKP